MAKSSPLRTDLDIMSSPGQYYDQETGLQFYYGFGLGIGVGASAVIHTGDPCAEVSVTGTARGEYPIGGIPVGGQVDVSIGQKSGLSAGAGAGLGLGFGASIAATHTIKIFSW